MRDFLHRQSPFLSFPVSSMAGNEAADLSNTVNDSLPTPQVIWSSIVQKICYVTDLLSSTGAYIKNTMDYSVDLLAKLYSFVDGSLRASLPYVLKTVDYSVVKAKTVVGVAGEGVRVSLPYVKHYVNFSVLQAQRLLNFMDAIVRASFPYVENTVNYSVVQGQKLLGSSVKVVRAGLPYVMATGNYSVEKMKQHPYICITGLILLLIWFKYCRSGGGGGGGRTMKAPGRNYRMPRADFERSPRSYFRDLRGTQG